MMRRHWNWLDRAADLFTYPNGDIVQVTFVLWLITGHPYRARAVGFAWENVD